MSGVLRFGAIGAALAALSLGVAAAQDARQQQNTPGQIFERVLRQTLQQPQTNQAVLAANAGWTNSGVTVERGTRLQITAQGQWSALSNARLTAANQAPPVIDANGYPGRTAPNAPLPNANLGALIGRIGDGAPFLIGASYRGEANAAGPLMLAMNDFNFADNQGRLSIAVAATAPPPVRPQPQPETTPTRPQDNAETPTTRRQPQDPVVETPPTRVPETTQPETPTPATNDVAPVEETPVEQSAPAQETPPVVASEPAQPAIPVTWAAAGLAAALLALALVANALRTPRRAPRRAPPTGRVGARVAHDGRDRQWLKVSWS